MRSDEIVLVEEHQSYGCYKTYEHLALLTTRYSMHCTSGVSGCDDYDDDPMRRISRSSRAVIRALLRSSWTSWQEYINNTALRDHHAILCQINVPTTQDGEDALAVIHVAACLTTIDAAMIWFPVNWRDWGFNTSVNKTKLNNTQTLNLLVDACLYYRPFGINCIALWRLCSWGYSPGVSFLGAGGACNSRNLEAISPLIWPPTHLDLQRRRIGPSCHYRSSWRSCNVSL